MIAKERKAFAQTIRPAVNGESDKFSWGIYKRALKHGRERVYLSSWCPISGAVAPNLEALKVVKGMCRMLMIGMEIDEADYFHGARLSDVTSGERSKFDNWAYGPNFGTAQWIDVTDWFWQQYALKGRCILHGDRVHSWQKINKNARKCIHCGKHERRTVETVKTIKRVEVWG